MFHTFMCIPVVCVHFLLFSLWFCPLPIFYCSEIDENESGEDLDDDDDLLADGIGVPENDTDEMKSRGGQLPGGRLRQIIFGAEYH